MVLDENIILSSLIFERICNDDDCPLKKIHQMPIEERVKWKDGLTREEIDQIISHYHECIRKHDGK